MLGFQIATPKLHSISVTQSILGIPIPIVYGTTRVQANLLWYGGFKAENAPMGGSGLGKSGYIYFADMVAALCQGPIAGIGSIWSTGGRLNLQSAQESYTVPTGGGTYVPANNSILASDTGVTRTDPYSYNVNDFGGPGPRTLSGMMQTVMVKVTGTPGTGQYSVGPGGYTFSSGDAGKTVTVNYSYSLYVLDETEDYNVPTTSPYEISVQNQVYFRTDLGVINITTGVALTAVGGTPTATMTYYVNNGNYYFYSGDAGMSVAISYSWRQMMSNLQPSQSLAFTLINGNQGQAPWSLLTSKYPSNALGYSTIALIAADQMYLGESGSPPDYNYEIQGPMQAGGGIIDADTANVIDDFLTNSLYGAGYTGQIDTTLTTLARNYWYASNFFISPAMQEQKAANQMVDELCSAGNVGVFFSEGKLKFIPYGDTSIVGNGQFYQAPTAAVVDLDDTDFLTLGQDEDPVQVERSPWEDAYNSVWVQFNNRINNYNPDIVHEHNDYAIGQFGLRQAPTKNCDYICRQDAATFVANAALNRLVYIRKKYKFTISGIRYGFLDPMDLVSLTDNAANLNNVPARIIQINEDDQGRLAIVAEEYPFGAFTSAIYNKQVNLQPNPGSNLTDPGPTTPVIFATTSQENKQTINSFKIAAASVNPAWGGCHVWVSTDNSTYNLFGTIRDVSRIGKTTSLLNVVADPDTTSVLGIDMSTSAGQLTGVSASAWNSFDTLAALIASNGSIELIAYENATLTGTNAYNLTNLRRGVYGSAIQSWPSGTTFVRLDETILEAQFATSNANQTLYFKFTSFNAGGSGSKEQTLAEAVEYTWNATTGATDISGGAAGVILLNPNFAAGNVGWTPQAGWAIVAGAGYNGSGYFAQYTGLSTAAITNNQTIPCSQGAVLSAACFVEGSSTATGQAYVRINFWNSSGAYITNNGGNDATANVGWVQSRIVATAPANTAYATIDFAVYSQTAGSWNVGGFTASILANSVDEVPDGSTYGRTLLSGINSGYAVNSYRSGVVYAIKGVGDPQILSFGNEIGGRTADLVTYTGGPTVESLQPAQAGADVTAQNGNILLQNPNFAAGNVGWSFGGFSGSIVATAGYLGSPYALSSGAGGTVAPVNNQNISCSAGAVISAVAMFKAPTGTAGTAVVRVQYWSITGASTGYQDGNSAAANGSWNQSRSVYIAPAGTAYANIAIVIYSSGAGWLAGGVTASILANSVDEVPDGTTYARPLGGALTGGYPTWLGVNNGHHLMSSGINRLGLYDGSNNPITAPTKRHVASQPFSQTNGALVNDGQTVYFNSANGTPYLKDSGGNNFPVFLNTPVLVLHAINPPSTLAQFTPTEITPTSFVVSAKTNASNTAYAIALTNADITYNSAYSATVLDTTTDAYNTNVVQSAAATLQVQFKVSVPTVKVVNSYGSPAYNGSIMFTAQVWSGNMGTLLATGNLSVNWASLGNISTGSLSLTTNIAVGAAFTVRVYATSATNPVGTATPVSGAVTGVYSSASSVNGIDMTSVILEGW